jgi:thioredoxin reductase
MEPTWDCIVVGAGAAGLSAALVLGRARRRTLVVDAGGQSNRPSDGIGGLLGHDRRPPEEFYALGRENVLAYPTVELRDGTVETARREDDGFAVELGDGSTETTHRLLLATGMDYRRPDVPGIAERWGRSVFHCPFCHGWEHRDAPLGVLSTVSHGALLLKMWTEEVTLLTNGEPLEPEEAEKLDVAGIPVDPRPIARLEGPGDQLTAVVFADGGRLELHGLLTRVTLHQRAALAEQLGAELAEPGMVAADALVVDAQHRTTVPGLFAAGDASAQMQSVALAISSGHVAGAMVVGDLMAAGKLKAPA